MTSPVSKSTARTTRNELMMLLLASIACALVLTLGVSQASPEGMRTIGLSRIALIGLVAGCGILACVFVWRALRAGRRALQAANATNTDLRKRLSMIEAVVNAEPQKLLFSFRKPRHLREAMANNLKARWMAPEQERL
ncbi:MAG: hypothetical protein AAFR75_13810, partial [Pseudomonadota bacterium]